MLSVVPFLAKEYETFNKDLFPIGMPKPMDAA
jgi:hypothetical protein